MFFSSTFEAQSDGSLLIITRGQSSAPIQRDFEVVRRCLLSVKSGTRVTLRVEGIVEPDSGLVAWLFSVARSCKGRGLVLDTSAIPEALARPLGLALSVRERGDARRDERRDDMLVAVGRATHHAMGSAAAFLAFIGELVAALWLCIRRRARVPVRDIWAIIEECGPGALPIVALISSLVGMILAFIGAQQLRQFGAQIYVANLVSIAMLREMGAVMAGVIMAGRTGAAFAAQLGTMQVNEEIDALQTFGISPMQYLVVPRVIALIVMMPLLCLYADLLGVAGGAIVSALTMNISFAQYLQQARTAVHISDMWLGVFKSGVFGVLIASAGCMCGMRCGRSASAVGIAVTSAVVAGIVAIVVADAVFAVLTECVGL